MYINPYPYFESGDILAWMVLVFNQSTYSLGYSIIMLFLVSACYLRTEKAGIASGLLAIISVSLIGVSNTPELNNILILFAALASIAPVYLIFFKRA